MPQQITIPNNYKRDLVKVRNPWGHWEWKGKWGDKDTIWSKVSQEVKYALDYENHDDGEYWMQFDDLLANFTYMTICRIFWTVPDEWEKGNGRELWLADQPNKLSAFKMVQDLDGMDIFWHQRQIYSIWVPGSTAGGSSKYQDTFYTNPQVQFQIEHEHDDMVHIVLAQPDTRSDPDKKNMRIGLNIFKVPEGNNVKVDAKTEILEMQAQGTMEHQSYRQLYKKFELDVGTYVIIPSTFHPDVAGKFLLRMLTETQAHVTELPIKD